MARYPAFVRRGELVDITIRTRDGRALLRPSPSLSACVLAVLARCLVLFDVHLHAFVFLSNHGHLLATVADAWHSASFVRTFKRNTTLGIQRITGWKGPVWNERTRPSAVLDDPAGVGRLKYILSNGVKEGLVDHPAQWPGPSSTHALLGDMTIAAPPFKLRPRNRRVGTIAAWAEEPGEPQLIKLTPLPAWASLSPEMHRGRIAGLLDEVVAEAAVARAGLPSLGVPTILAADPFATTELDETPAPLAHYTSADAYLRFKAERAAFIDRFVAAGAKLRECAVPVSFPRGAFLPSQGFFEE